MESGGVAECELPCVDDDVAMAPMQRGPQCPLEERGTGHVQFTNDDDMVGTTRPWAHAEASRVTRRGPEVARRRTSVHAPSTRQRSPERALPGRRRSAAWLMVLTKADISDAMRRKANF